MLLKMFVDRAVALAPGCSVRSCTDRVDPLDPLGPPVGVPAEHLEDEPGGEWGEELLAQVRVPAFDERVDELGG